MPRLVYPCPFWGLGLRILSDFGVLRLAVFQGSPSRQVSFGWSSGGPSTKLGFRIQRSDEGPTPDNP